MEFPRKMLVKTKVKFLNGRFVERIVITIIDGKALYILSGFEKEYSKGKPFKVEFSEEFEEIYKPVDMDRKQFLETMKKGVGIRVIGWQSKDLFYYNLPYTSTGYIDFQYGGERFINCEYTEDDGTTFKCFKG